MNYNCKGTCSAWMKEQQHYFLWYQKGVECKYKGCNVPVEMVYLQCKDTTNTFSAVMRITSSAKITDTFSYIMRITCCAFIKGTSTAWIWVHEVLR